MLQSAAPAAAAGSTIAGEWKSRRGICSFSADGRAPRVCVTAEACASCVSRGPALAGSGLRRWSSTSGRAMMEPEASLPRVTRTLEPSSK